VPHVARQRRIRHAQPLHHEGEDALAHVLLQADANGIQAAIKVEQRVTHATSCHGCQGCQEENLKKRAETLQLALRSVKGR
jgi:hypothetical protein